MRIVWIALALAGCQFQLPTGTSKSTRTTTTGLPPGTGTGTPPVTTVTGSVTVEDRFLQAPAQKSDVLFVIDDSGLVPDLETVAEQVPLLLNWFLGSGIDYHIGVVTTDLDDPAKAGKLIEADGLKYVDPDTASPIDALALMLDVPMTGSATVQLFGATVAALETNADTWNAGFLRDESTVTVIAVGDGHDASVGLLQAEFEEWFVDFRPELDQRSFSCLLAPGVALGTTCGTTAAVVGGIEAGVDDAAAYDAIALGATGLTRQFFLTADADPTRIEVTVESASGATLSFVEAQFDAYGALLSGDWTFDPVTNAVSFVEYVPSTGDTVVVRYRTVP